MHSILLKPACTAVSHVTVSEMWKAIIEVCPAWAKCLPMPLGYQVVQRKYLKVERILSVIDTYGM